jgi:hypothetical protein
VPTSWPNEGTGKNVKGPGVDLVLEKKRMQVPNSDSDQRWRSGCIR